MPHGFLGVSPEEYQKAAELAKEVLSLSRNTLRMRLRFLDEAINRLEPAVHAEIAFATDGRILYFEPFSLLKHYQTEPEAMSRNYLHVLLHCLLRHMYFHRQLEPAVWDLACDITVEVVISGLGFPASRESQQAAVMESLRKAVKHLTAENIYRYYLEQNLSTGRLRELRDAFRADDHGLWYQEDGFLPSGNGQTEQHWEALSRHVQGDLESFSRNRGEEAANLLQNLTAINRERYDYAAFLRKFASRQEVMRIDDQEFDYIFYTYGLRLYGKMPLIEPLEYKEVKRIREFVIAIDTSGSVSGELVQAFVEKTYHILQSAESFDETINVHIIQCDQQIQEDVKITSREAFDEYIQHMTLRGFGGTDFRPVFSYVEQLREKGEFTNLKGLIYFTDGLGTFPEQKPDYDTAFVFLDEDTQNPKVPAWAIKLILTREEIKEVRR